jgi:predicted nucleic acid-binding protein
MAIKKPDSIFFDSNIYIDILRSREHAQKIETILTGAYLYVVNKIVLMELWAGARNKTEERILAQHESAFPLIGMSDDNFILAGQIMSKMRQKFDPAPAMRRRLTWDILIALSAKENQSIVVTANVKDFGKIKTFVDFDYLSFNVTKLT